MVSQHSVHTVDAILHRRIGARRPVGDIKPIAVAVPGLRPRQAVAFLGMDTQVSGVVVSQAGNKQAGRLFEMKSEVLSEIIGNALANLTDWLR